MYDTFFYILQPPAAKISKRTQIVTGHLALIPNIMIDPKPHKNSKIKLKIIISPFSNYFPASDREKSPKGHTLLLNMWQMS